MRLKKLKITYEELFKLQKWSKNSYNETQPSNIDMYIDTPSGKTKIKAGVVKPKLEMYNILFEDGSKCNVASTHIFSYKGKEVFAKDAEYVDTKTGIQKIITKEKIGKHDGYDINIDSPHWYYNSDGVVYHNTVLMTDLLSGQLKMSKNILLISMEMQDKELMKRVHANALDLSINGIKDMSPDAIRIAKEKFKTNGNLFIKDYPAGSFSALMLDSLLDSYKNEKGIEFDIVYLDYLGIMKSDLLSPSAGLYSYVKSITEEVRAVATKRQIPIISASQLNRGATGANLNIQEVGNESISDSIGTSMTADFMLFLLQTPQMKEEGLITCKATKNRFTGRTDFWDMNIDYKHMRFSDVIVQPGDMNSTRVGMTESQIKTHLNNITSKDIKIIKKHDKALTLEDDFDVLNELGLK